MSPSTKAATSKRKVQLRVSTPDENTFIRVLDGNLSELRLKQNLGEIAVDVRPGVYVVELQRGREVQTRAVVVRDEPVHVHVFEGEEPAFASAAPVEGTSTSHEPHSAGAATLSRAEPLALHTGKHPGHLLLFARSSESALTSAPEISLHTLEGERVFMLAEQFKTDAGAWFGEHLTLDPGAYRVRRNVGKTFFEQTIFVVERWQTQLFFLYERPNPNAEYTLARTSVLMAKPNVAFEPGRQEMLWTESALRALEEGTSLPGRDAQGMFRGKFENPMLGIYAGLLHLRRDEINAKLMRTVFNNLYRMVGPLPDVLALGWGLARRSGADRKDKAFIDRLCDDKALNAPPMLRESWLHLSLAKAKSGEVIGFSSFAARAAVNLMAARPWLVWEGDPPQLEKPTEASVTGRSGLLTRIMDGLKEFLAGPSIEFMLPRVLTALQQIPDVGYYLRRDEFTHLERSLARLLHPLIDPSLTRMVDESPAFKRAIMASQQKRDKVTAQRLVEQLNLPPVTILGSLWGLYRKLVLQAMPPQSSHLNQFARGEAQGSAALEGVLKALRDEKTAIVHRLSGRPLDALQLLFLRFRGRPGVSSGRLTVKEAIGTLNSADFVVDGKPVNARKLKAEMERIRARVVEGIAAARFGTRKVKADWRDAVFATPTSYERGKLLKGLFEEAQQPAEAEDWSELQMLKGIGPKTQQALREEGVTRLEQLANMGDASVTALDERLPGARARLQKFNWREQAQTLVDKMGK